MKKLKTEKTRKRKTDSVFLHKEEKSSISIDMEVFFMPKKRKKRMSSNENKNPRTAFIKRILWGSLYSITAFFVILLALAFVVMKAGISDSMQTVFAFAASLLGTFIGAFLSLRKTHEKGLVSGVFVSVPATIIMCIVLLAVFGELGIKTGIMALLMMLGGALGGIAAVNK